jgi:hypothetical protein
LRPTIKQILRRFEQAQTRSNSHRRETVPPLEADRQPVGAEATGHAHRRMSGHVEGHGPGKPVRPDIAKYFAIDFDGAEQILLDRKRGPRIVGMTSRSARASSDCTRRNRMVRSNIACW